MAYTAEDYKVLKAQAVAALAAARGERDTLDTLGDWWAGVVGGQDRWKPLEQQILKADDDVWNGKLDAACDRLVSVIFELGQKPQLASGVNVEKGAGPSNYTKDLTLTNEIKKQAGETFDFLDKESRPYLYAILIAAGVVIAIRILK